MQIINANHYVFATVRIDGKRIRVIEWMSTWEPMEQLSFSECWFAIDAYARQYGLWIGNFIELMRK